MEKNFQRDCAARAKAAGWLVLKMGAISVRGFPDLLMVAPAPSAELPITGSARIVLVELKNPNGRGVLRKLQARMLADLMTRGVEVHVCDSKEAFTKILNG